MNLAGVPSHLTGGAKVNSITTERRRRKKTISQFEKKQTKTNQRLSA